MKETESIALEADQLFSNVAPHEDADKVASTYWHLAKNETRLVIVMDDDPTGIQTVHGVKMYLRWSPELMHDVFRQEKLVYFLTNARSVSEARAVEINTEIVQLAIEASQRTQREFTIISRSDSSLRGHFPAEPEAIRSQLESAGQDISALFMIPFYQEGGRFTYEDTHYVRQGRQLMPVHTTEFATDINFSFHHSDLKAYVEEKSHSRYAADKVKSISLATLRSGNSEALADWILSWQKFALVVVNALDYTDLQVLVTAVRLAEQKGKRFIYRTAASFVKAYGFIPDRPLISADEVVKMGQLTKNPPLIVVGSYTAVTAAQLNTLKETQTHLKFIELAVPELIRSDATQAAEIDRKLIQLAQVLQEGRTPVLFTSREVIKSDRQDENFRISTRVSASLSEIVRRLPTRPRAIISKGGITSHDLALHGLAMTEALVAGQLDAGVSLVIGGSESKWPGIPYVIFPGNIGDEKALNRVYEKLME